METVAVATLTRPGGGWLMLPSERTGPTQDGLAAKQLTVAGGLKARLLERKRQVEEVAQ
jgi:hypothetical protein